MVDIIKEKERIILKYQPFGGDEWLEKAINEKQEDITISKRYNFSYKDYLGKDEYDYHLFCLATKSDKYYFIRKEILKVSFDVYIDENYPINNKMFEIVLNNMNSFGAINMVFHKEKLYIGGDKEDIPSEDFQEIIDKFPTYYEKDLYLKSRIEEILKSYFHFTKSYTQKLNDFVTKKNITKSSILNDFNVYDIEKYELILQHLKEMIKRYNTYTERMWQNEILKIITLIMPQYIFTLNSISIKIKPKERKQIDIVLVNANGNIDLIEIKRYDDGNLIGKNPDSRNNYKPSSNLSSAIVQAEKYAYLCNVYNEKVTKEIEKKVKNKYNIDFKVNIINPKTLIIMGNSKDMNTKKKEDFELIRRMYANVIDIITYEDLVNRLENLIEALKAGNKYKEEMT